METLKDISNLPYCYRIDNLPEISAIYFMVKENKILYIGQSSNIRKRLSSHRWIVKNYVPKIHYLEVWDNKNRLELENYYINKFLPLYNRMIKNIN